MSLVAVKIASGAAFAIYALEENGSCPLTEFLEQIDQVDADRILRCFDWTKQRGLMRNDERSKKLENGMFYFRTRGGVRVFYFSDAKILVCTNGYIKKKDKLDPREIKRAELWRTKYFNSKASKILIFREE